MEFGVGFSTLVFGFHKRISKVFSIEEFNEFVPKYLNSTNHILIREVVSFGSSRKFREIDYNFGPFDLIYIDGPQTPLLSGNAEPNLDLFEIKLTQLKNTIVSIDVRYQTVSLVHKYLKNTHSMFLSRRMESRLKYLDFVSDEFLDEYYKKGSLLKLTTVFIPRHFNTILGRINR
jgi:hypothetical protein